MAHHGHFMESWLTVEDHKIAVCDVPLHLVTTLQMEVRGFGMVAKVDPGTVVPHDVLGTGVLVVATLN